MRVALRFLILLLVIVAATFPIAAQENTPQPGQNLILGWTNEVIFPEAIRFTLTLAQPLSEVAGATLIVQPEGGSAAPVEINLNEAAIVREPYTELAYVWQIPRDNLPRLFENVTFTWRTTSTNNETSQITDRFTFTDQRAGWAREADPRGQINLAIPSGGPSVEAAQITPGELLTPAAPASQVQAGIEATEEVTILEPSGGLGGVEPASGLTPNVPQPTSDSPDTSGVAQLRRQLQPVYDLLAENTGISPSFNVIVYTSAFPPGCVQNGAGASVAVGPFSGVEVPCDPTMANAIFSASGYDVVQSDSDSLNRMQALLTHFLTRGFYEVAWAGKNVPDWFAAGLGQLYSAGLKTRLYPPLLSAARTGTLLSLDRMADEPAPDAAYDLWEAQSYGMVAYIASQIGLQGLFDLARNIGDADSFSEAYEAAMGSPLDLLLASFESWIFTNRAPDAFAFTPYQAATPTPTPSRTPTLTRTPTVTPTLTFTPTPTVTGVLTNTPTLTPTPSRTPTPAPATPTPRPAGSLNTATPTPIPTVDVVSALDSPNAALAILAIGLVIIAAVALLFTRFRGR